MNQEPRDQPSATRANLSQPAHALTAESVLNQQDVHPDEGLSAEEVTERHEKFGRNQLPSAPRPSSLKRLLLQFDNLLIYVLIGAAVMTAALQHWVDTIVILAVVVVNAIIGFVQEGKAESALAAIRDMLSPTTSVIRDGQRIEIDSADLVPGDIVVLEAGDRVAADLRLFEARGAKIDESPLTGESVPVEKTTAAVTADAPLAERTCIAHSGTMLTAGYCRGVVVATGCQSELGRISGMIAEVEAVETPLLSQMRQFAKVLTIVILGIGAVLLLLGLAYSDYPVSELFMMLVGLSVAAIPEGLPAILTVTLAIGVQSMARRNAIVRRLPAIEALGSVSVICSDKTGTLTRNEMTVRDVITPKGEYRVSGEGYTPHGGFSKADHDISTSEHQDLLQLARGALLCNDADAWLAEGEWRHTGDPMEAALLAMAGKAGFDPKSERRQYPRNDAIPFDATHKFMATLHHDHMGSSIVFMKGAPEVVIDRCAACYGENEETPLDKAHWHEAAEKLAASGRRVLALACKPRTESGPLSFDELDEGLSLLGLVGLIDPPREEAITAVALCQQAGIRVKMITGDHAATAAAIGQQLGLKATSQVLSGKDIEAMDDQALASQLARVDVFARTSPEHKLRLVRALQAQGEVVAMTGDGVNDAPALKRADIGIAMGGKGTEAAKDASEIVLADDNFATIAAAVEAGRTVYDNLKKAIVFLLPVNGGESLTLIAALALGITPPITPVQLLWVNMVSSVVLAMTLAFERTEPETMRRPPRPASEPIISRFILWRVGFVSLLFMLGIFGNFTLAQQNGASIEEARTMAVNTLIAMEIFYLFAVRFLHGRSLSLRGALGTKPVLIAIGVVLSLQAMFTYAPFMEAFFHTAALSLRELGYITLTGVGVLLILEAEKGLLKRFMR
ncbi:MAG: cation-transporting P-type ATPase [Halieaceae bacterium]|jgi:magnesium-transporting ATPase (P-type)|nr:cation-transporting P-type ATPase [Halieaceae bacterium]